MILPSIRQIQTYLRLHPYKVAAGSVILSTVLLRMYLINAGWAPTDSDESMTGLTALHIANRGEHPIFFYGETYMGAFEAYLAAAWFKLFGPSLFGLRVGIVGMYAVFLATLYAFIARLYTRPLALLTLIILSLGSGEMLFRQTEAAGGYLETLCCAAALFLLALLAHRTPDLRQRVVLYALWGVVAGIGLWSDMLILPWLAGSGIVLAWDWWRWHRTFRHRQWLVVAMLVLGLSVGAFPLILFNLNAPPGNGTITVLVHQVINGGSGAPVKDSSNLGQRIAGTVLVSLPWATGGTALCSVKAANAWPLSANSSAETIACTVEHGVWGIGFIALGIIAIWGELAMLWHFRLEREIKPDALVVPVTRLAVLVSAGGTLLVYALSPAPGLTPTSSARYLTGLFIAIPALLWPMWRLLVGSWQRNRYVGTYAAFVSLWGIIFVLLTGTVNTLHLPASVVQKNTQRTQLIAQLQHLHATRIYADYWTCNWVMFLTHEQILCGVLDEQLQEGQNRYPPYLSIVQSAPHPAYVFPLGSPQAASMDRHPVAQRIATAQYVIYFNS